MVHRTLNEVAGAIGIGLQRTVAATSPRGWVLPAREQQYGGRSYVAASRFLRRAWLASGLTARLRCVADLRGMAAALAMLWRVPRVWVALSDSASGQAIGAHLNERRFGIPKHRIAQGVLVVPDSLEEYLRGRHRQAVRTNIRRARTLGTRCRRLTQVDERRQFAELLDPELTDPWKREQMLTRPEAACWIALDADEQPVGLAVLSVDGDVAMLWSLVGRNYPERWLLHTQVVDMLATEGVRHLLVAARMAPLLEPGIQYFQRLLGYRVAHVSVRKRRSHMTAAA
ncbi:MAG: hypothetical protein ACRDKY_01075 [Solirubrobacteraceae bacterium]